VSKGLKTILAIAGSVLIPFAAPALIGASGFLTGVAGAIGTTATNALVSAGLGAVKGAVLGEDIGRSALMAGAGSLTSSFGSKIGSATSTTARNAGTASNVTNAATNAAAPAGLNTATNAAAGSGLASAGTGLAGASPALAGLATNGAQAASLASGVSGAIRAAGSTVGNVVRSIPGLGDLTADRFMAAAAPLLGSAVSGAADMSAQEQALLRQQTEALRQLQSSNKALFDAKMAEAMSMSNDARQMNPEYFARLAANRALVQGSVAKTSGIRGMVGERRQAEGRRFDLGAQRNIGTAYTTGYGTGLNSRAQMRQSAAAAMPSSAPDNSTAYTALQAGYGTAARNSAEQQAAIGNFFGGLFKDPYADKANSTGIG